MSHPWIHLPRHRVLLPLLAALPLLLDLLSRWLSVGPLEVTVHVLSIRHSLQLSMILPEEMLRVLSKRHPLLICQLSVILPEGMLLVVSKRHPNLMRQPSMHLQRPWIYLHLLPVLPLLLRLRRCQLSVILLEGMLHVLSKQLPLLMW
mmetsp:Transcript_75313/g.244924  ORF Transcript_75313/g.244924 Transcript_75313/m.244924 type:complete len:148 (+) Transcript_75313:502-945(+)